MSGPRHAKGTGAGFVYDELRREILRLRLVPGAALDEAGLVIRFGLSRTPVREALIRLAADGLVTMLSNRKAQVSTLDLGNFPRFVEALNLLQRAIMLLAALRRSGFRPGQGIGKNFMRNPYKQDTEYRACAQTTRYL